MFRSRILAALLAASPFSVLAAGFEIPENGALPLARGGTFGGQLDTAYAVAFNPAGLSLIDGLDVRLDARFVKHDVSFLRAETDRLTFDEVSNTAGIYTGPMFTAAYGRALGKGRLGVGLGIFGPAGVGKYRYPHPDDFAESDMDSTEKSVASAQRYTSIETNTLIMYPSLAVSYALKDFSFGLTFQSVFAEIGILQAMNASIDGSESPDWDVLVGFKAKDAMTPTAIVGASWNPLPKLRVHGSFRPTVSINAEGPLDLKFGSAVESLVEVSGAKTTKLDIKLPPVAKLGAVWNAERFLAAFDLVYEGWSVNEQFVITPDVMISQLGGEPAAMEAVKIDKEWKDSFGARLGGTYRVLPAKTKGDFSFDVHAGALFESNAIPAERQGIDYVTGDRFGGSLGLSVGWQGFSLTASAMGYLPNTMEITNSKVVADSPTSAAEPAVVGNGTYKTQGWIAAVGLSYTGLGSSK